MLTHLRADYLLGSLHQLNSAIGMMEGAHVPRYAVAGATPQSGGYKSPQGHLTSLLKPLRRDEVSIPKVLPSHSFQD